VKRPANVTVTAAPLLFLNVVFVNGANVPSAAIPNPAPGRAAKPGLSSDPLGEQGRL